jgi:FAD/FMN-containing dehydrogenase
MTQRLKYANWGRVPAPPQQLLPALPHTLAHLQQLNAPLLGYGLGRSYGDSCLNSGGTLLSSHPLNAVRQFDRETGVLRAEAGVTLQTILQLCKEPNADGSFWFLPVLPGTQFVTLGGAVANDVHGKNHQHRGSFGCYVRSLCLHRGDGNVLECSATENTELFAATIGGMGLTGFISEVEIQLMRIPGTALEVETLNFYHVRDYAVLAERSADWEYTVAWIDCFAPDHALGRGIFSRARHKAGHAPSHGSSIRARLTIPFTLPFSPFNRVTLREFNKLYLKRNRAAGWARSQPHYTRFFFPLDRILHWNRLYGPRGFFQYQCAIPGRKAIHGIEQLLKVICASGQGSSLAVLKSFGEQRSPGILSFPREGLTLAMDFPNRGAKTLALLAELDRITLEHGGRIYPAKDGRVHAETYHAMTPELTQFLPHVDPAFSSDFWKRIHP